jgi:glycosyltransferase involved in cell wall biosynthesis
MKENVRQSILGDALSINVISNGVNLNIYKPRPKQEARSKLDLPLNGKYLLWAAGGKGNFRKGYHLVVEAMEEIQARSKSSPTLLTMGGEEGWSKSETLKKVHHFGYVKDPEKQAMIYAAADAFLCSTLADGQPQTALESLACGTPILAFDIGPMPDLAINGKTGLLAPDTTAKDLIYVIDAFLAMEENHPEMSVHCRSQAVEKYDIKKQTEAYIRLYEDILSV